MSKAKRKAIKLKARAQWSIYATKTANKTKK